MRPLIFFLAAPALLAQVEIGATGGVPLSGFVKNQVSGSRAGYTRVSSAPRRYTLGPAFTWQLRSPVALRTGFLYKWFGFDTFAQGGLLTRTTVESRTTGNSWEVPLLGSVRLRFLRGVNAFITAGPTIRRLSGIVETGRRTVISTFPPPASMDEVAVENRAPQTLNRRTSIGGTFGGGIEVRSGRFVVRPELRLTRWDTERTSSQAAASRLHRTQADALLTIAYAVRDAESAARVPCCLEPGILGALSLLASSSTPRAGNLKTPAHRPSGGALLEWRFHPRYSLEGSFVVRSFGFTETDAFRVTTISGYTWEAPLLARWRVLATRWGNFLAGAGPALRIISRAQYDISDLGRVPASFLERSAWGFAVSGGVEIPAGSLRLRPEVRYTRFQRPIYDFYNVRSRQDGLYAMFGMSWRRRR